MATPAEMLDVIAHALTLRAERHGVVFRSHAPQILGQTGRLIGTDDGGPLYGYTKRQLRKVRDVIYAAARHDLAGGAG
jgi:hypothetical protein